MIKNAGLFKSFISKRFWNNFSLYERSFPVFIFIFIYSSLSFSQTYTWGNVAMGGGGFITGVITHKTSGDIYCRTDVGGAYRWDAANSKWIPLLDWNSDNETTYQGAEALALDPQNANNLYILAGTSYWNGGKTAILKSTDKGNTFTTTVVTTQFTAHGNGMGRSNGERLAVDPNNSNILFCGTRANGLWKSTNGGATWTQAWSGVTTTTNANGICFVVIDPSVVSGGASQNIYIGISRSGGGAGSNNIYRSTDGGANFTSITPTTSFMPHRAVLSADNSTLYVTMAEEEGPWNCATGRVYKYATGTGTWTNITPNGNDNYAYGGVSVDPGNANRVIVSTINEFDNSQYGTVWGDYVYLSTNGGSSWTSKLTSTSTYNNNGIGWCNGQIHWIGSIQFDPLNTAKVWAVSGNGIFSCNDINAVNTAWKFDVKEIEETVPQDAVSIPGGPLVSVILDYDGFVHSDITAYPASRHTPNGGHNTGIAYAAGLTTKLVRIGKTTGGADAMYYSTNQGASWTQTGSMNGSGGKVALSVDGSHILHCPDGSNTTYYSTNNGTSWNSTGLNINNAFPVTDKVNTNKIYAYNSGTGVMYVSTNEGVSFAAANATAMAVAWNSSKRICTVSGNEGHIWVANGDQGLSYSTNSGSTFTKLANVTYCIAVGIGKAEPSATYPSIYIWGTVGGVRGMFRSIDQGVNWTRVNDDAHEFGGPGNAEMVIGDMNTYGRVFMSTAGRGIVYWELDSSLPVSLLSFDGKYVGSDIELKWKVTSESDMQGYKLLRSTNPGEKSAWKEIGFVWSVNSGENIHTYTYKDLNPSQSSFIYYKLISLDKDGSIAESKAILVSEENSLMDFSVYPNPSGRYFTVSINEDLETPSYVLQIMNLSGQILQEIKTDPGVRTFSVGENLSSGIYFLRVRSASGQQIIKLIKE